MAYTRVIDPSSRRIVVTARGQSDVEATVAEVKAIARDLAGHPGFVVLVDTRAADYVPSFDEVRRIVECFTDNRAAFKRGIAVVVEGAVHFGLGRMFSTLAGLGGMTIEVFLSESEAGLWLDALVRPHDGATPSGT